MDPLWLLRGEPDAPGWRELEKAAKNDEIDWRLFDRDAWALIRAPEPPTQYEGMEPSEPPDGLYVDQNGNSLCLVNRQEVAGPAAVIAALGAEAEALLAKIKDPIAVLERLGRAY